MEAITMSQVHQRFAVAVRDVAALSRNPDRIAEVQLHALYRQATEGDCWEARPTNGDIGQNFRYDAWVALRGTPPEEAMERYIAMARDLTLALN